MEISTIGFTKKSAGQFFGALRSAGIKRLIDVRLNNVSQLAGFTKRDDLSFFLREICGIDYIHELLLAPEQAMLDDYRKRKIGWIEYEQRFLELMRERCIESRLDHSLFHVPNVLLCSEATADRCHRRLVVEYLAGTWGDVEAIHL